ISAWEDDVNLTAETRKSAERENLFEPPRFEGGNYVCVKANLGALPTLKALKAWLDETPRCKVRWQGLCKFCGHYHADTIAPDPAGETSGTGRNAKILARPGPKPAWLVETKPEEQK